MCQTQKNNLTEDDFNPVWWALNSHIHTVIASQLTPVKKPPCRRIEISTPDNDFLEIDICLADGVKPIVALFHGLEGSSDRHYITNLMSALLEKGYSSAALNFRGCGSRLNNQKRFYHSGETDDYATFLKWIREQHPSKKIYAVGFSLGGNALVKYLGETGESSLIERAAVVSPPFDLKEGALKLNQGINRMYEAHFLKTMVDKLEIKRSRFGTMPEYTGNSIYEFDDQVTAKLHGFDGAEDYYEKCSSKNFYKDVRKELFIIHSKKDPLCPFEYAPLGDMNENPRIHCCITENGGHVGFLSSPRGWMIRKITDWLTTD
jgi:predicted alpha/beta-fold hydrolase